MTVIYTAEQDSGDLFIVAAWDGLSRPSFKEFVLDNLSQNHIPEPDRNVQQLELCEWEDDALGRYLSDDPDRPSVVSAWKNANYCTLYWTYPGVWSETHVSKMPPELAAEFGFGEGLDRTDPKHPDFHDTMAGVWDNRERGVS